MARRKTTEEFVREAKEVHGDRYDYSLVEYKNYMTPVKIVCNKHGVFEKNLAHHLRGQGCPKCIHRGKDVLEFIRQAKELYGYKYDYSLVNYKNNCSKVIIKCNKGHIFKKTPANFLLGYGCMECSVLDKHNDFIRRAKIIHNNKYDYRHVKYLRSIDIVDIICPKHGLFKQSPKGHLKGKGCVKCGIESSVNSSKENSPGWSVNSWQKSGERSKNFDSFKVYIIKCWNDNEIFYKIGRTFKTTNSRFKSKKEMPYRYEIIEEIIFDTAKRAFDKETDLKRLNNKFKYIPLKTFGGMNECFSKYPIY